MDGGKDVSLVRLPVGSRKVGSVKETPVIYLGKEYKWLIGKRVYVELLVKAESR